MKITDIHVYQRLREEGTVVSETSLYLLISKFTKIGTVADRKRSPDLLFLTLNITSLMIKPWRKTMN